MNASDNKPNTPVGWATRCPCCLWMSILIWACAACFCNSSMAQEKPDEKVKEKQTEKKTPIRATFNFGNADPKQLFQTLSETYQVQFDEGAEGVTEPITLIANDVDLLGMLKQLNEALSREGKTTVLEGQIVRIVPMLDSQETWITLNYAKASDVVLFLADLYLAKSSDKPEDQARKAKVIKAHPELQKILVIGPQNVVRDIEKLVKNELDLAPAKPAVPTSPKVPVKKKYISLEYMDAQQFILLLNSDETLRDQLDATVAPNNTVILSSRDETLFKRVEEMKKAFDVDKMEIRYIPLSNALAEDVAKLIKQIYPAEAPRLPPELEQLRREQMGVTDQDTGLYGSVTQDFLDKTGMAEVSIGDLRSQPLSVLAVGELTIVP
ncbi:MAG: hypothetical protein IID32_06190, partial [Planctomycetes bacterium]|nr:hypothetical protein [Planctomycetota bacterium]